MRLSDLNIGTDRLVDICRRYHVVKLEVFGSFASGEAGERSDLDFMVTFEPNANIGLGFISLQQELERLFARPVDLLTRRSVEESQNKYFRRFALSHAQVLYEQAA